jgi:type II secretory pathway pseudopilin PulG
LAYCAYCGSHVGQVSFVPCASCGNPTNGAPVRPVGGGGPNVLVVVIGIAVAGLIAVAIIGILAAIAVPNLMLAQQRSRQKRTMADIRTIATVLESYGADHEKEEFPPGPTAEALRPHVEPEYIKKLPTIDGWGQAFRYMPLPNHGYVIVSAGGDKVFEPERPDRYTTEFKTNNFDHDIIYANGRFMQFPEGRQDSGAQ